MKVYQLFMNEYGGNLLMHVVRRPMVLLNGKRIVLVSHDETVLHQNDGTRWSYREKGHENMPLQQKAMGVGLHVSGFLSEDVGVIEILRSLTTSGSVKSHRCRLMRLANALNRTSFMTPSPDPSRPTSRS